MWIVPVDNANNDSAEIQPDQSGHQVNEDDKKNGLARSIARLYFHRAIGIIVKINKNISEHKMAWYLNYS